MEQWTEVRRRVLTGELSKRTACREFKLSWHTLAKMLAYAEPPGYRQKVPRRKVKLQPFLPIIHEILEADRQAPPKQRHTATRIFQRLQQEHDYDGGYTSVRRAVQPIGRANFLRPSRCGSRSRPTIRRAMTAVWGTRSRRRKSSPPRRHWNHPKYRISPTRCQSSSISRRNPRCPLHSPCNRTWRRGGCARRRRRRTDQSGAQGRGRRFSGALT